MPTPDNQSLWTYLNRPLTETFGRPMPRRALDQQTLLLFLLAIVGGLIILAVELTH